MIKRLSLLVCLLVTLGCKAFEVPPGAQFQSSMFGLKFSPGDPRAPFVMGSWTDIMTTPQPENAGPNLNRFEGKAGLTGATVKSTVASGPVGEQLKAAGGAAAVLHPPDAPALQQAGVPPSPALPSSPALATQLGEPVAVE